MRRIEAVTGPEAVRHVRCHDRVLHEAADLLRAHTEAVPAAVAALREQAREAAKARATNGAVDVVLARLARAARSTGRSCSTEVVEAPDAKALLDLADRVKGKLGESAAIVLGLRGGRPRPSRGERHAGARRSAA